MTQTVCDALSLHANTPSSAPKLIFSMLEDGTISYPALTQGSSRYYVTNASGLDSLGFGAANMGAAFNCTGGYIRKEITLAAADANAIPINVGDVVTGTEADIAAVWSYSSVPNDTNRGLGNKLVVTQLKRSYTEWIGPGHPQTWTQINRNTFTNPMPPICYRFKMRIPANMENVLADLPGYNAWFENFAIKAHTNNNLTDSRLSIQTVRKSGETQVRIKLAFDLFLKTLAGVDVVGLTNLWNEESELGAVTPGDWYDIYLYVDHRAVNTDLSGVTQILVLNESKNTVVMSKTITGVPTKGFYNYEQGRIYVRGVYTGGFPSSGNIQFEYSDVIFFDKPPIFIGGAATS